MRPEIYTEGELPRCPITTQVFFSQMKLECGHNFEADAIHNWQQLNDDKATCPCCRASITEFNPVSDSKLNCTLSENPAFWNEVYFDVAAFEESFKKNELDPRIIVLLENAKDHLNHKPIVGKSPIEILAETPAGRDLLRKKLKIVSTSSSSSAASSGAGKYFFDNAEISAESLQIQVNGKSIREWLSITTAMEIALDEEQKARQAIDVEAQTTYRQLQAEFSRARLFLLRGARGAAASQRIPSDAVNPILQQVVYGNENAVKAALKTVKDNATQLSALLSDTGTVKDYSDREFTGMTLLQAAAAAGDIDMCLMLKNYMPPEEFAKQLAEIFPEGIEAHEAKQQRNAFKFDAILAAIQSASTADLGAALNKIGAQFTESDSVRVKSDSALSLTEALNRFREQFTQLSHHEKIFNPQHLLRAFEKYDALWDQCERDGSDRDSKKRDLFWRQIIGYTQRFMPACYAQAFSQGLYYLEKGDQPNSCNEWRPQTFRRDLQLSWDNFFYFPLPPDSHSGLGFDFAIDPSCGRQRRPWVGLFGPCMSHSFKNFCRAKTSSFQNIMPRVRVQQRVQSDERRCVVQ